MATEKENLEFKINDSETNIRWLFGEPESPRKTRLIRFHRREIKKSKKRLDEINSQSQSN